MPEDEDRPRDAAGGAGAGLPDPDQLDTAWAQAPAPDDISELARDIAAYRRECRTSRRRAYLRRLYARRGAAPITFTLAAVAVAAIVATLLTLVGAGASSHYYTALPLATRPPAAVGQQGGLMADVMLHPASGGVPVNARALRPGVVAIIQDKCNCEPLLNAVAKDASARHLRLDVVAPSAADASAAALDGRLGDNATLFYDPTQALTKTLATSTSGVTLALINRNGIIYKVTSGVTSETTSGLSVSLVNMLLRPGTHV